MARYTGYALCLFSVLVILYWGLGYVPEGRTSTKANTGLCFFLLAIQLIINANKQNQLQWFHLIPSGITIAIALLSFIENIFGADYSIDQLLIGNDQNSFNLMSTGTAAFFMLLGSVSFWVGKKTIVTDNLIAVTTNVVRIIVLISIISHVFVPSEASKPDFWSTMSLLTTFLFILATIGLSSLRPDIGFIRIFRAKDLGSIVAKRLVMIIIIAALLLGSLLYYFYQRQVLSAEFRFVILITISIVLAMSATVYLETLISTLEQKRKELNEALKQTLSEKEELLKELHHRIKNNLQLISSLMYIQSTTTKDDKFKNFLLEINGRIQAIYTIHEFLLQRKITNSLNVKEYLNSLSRQLVASYGKTEKKFSLELSCEDLEMDPDHAFNIGIIFNETILCLIKNTMIPQSEIHFSLKTNEHDILLTFVDRLPENQDNFLVNFKQSIYIENLEMFIGLLKGTTDYQLGADFRILISLTNQA